MCGIIGIVGRGTVRADRDIAARMLASIEHRGPDSTGIWNADGAVFGGARLSIIDHSAGPQPILNEDGTLVLVCNGEIFNHVELREDLRNRGHKFRTKTDVEVLLHLFEERGANLLDNVLGQFAFAIYDAQSGKLTLGRDRTGISPLFFCDVGQQTLFASEIKALFEVAEVPRKFSLLNLDVSLATWTVPAPHTIYEGIYQVEPGTLIEVQNGKKKKTQYWSLDFTQEEIPFQDAKQQLGDALARSVTRNLVADVPVGLYLSGGIDSSILAGLVAMSGMNDLNAYSVSFTDQEFDESSFQKEVAKKWGISHHELVVSASDIATHFPDTVKHAETTLFRTAPVPLFLLSEQVNRSGLKVVLSGEGADEIFWGYDTYRELMIRLMWSRNTGSKWRPERFREIFPYFKAYQEPRGLALVKKFYAADRDNVGDLYYSLRPRWRANSSLNALIHDRLRPKQDMEKLIGQSISNISSDFKTLDHFQKYQLLEMQGLLAGYLLSSQGDRMLMSHSVEGRPPFLDKEVIELAAKFPNRYKCRGLKDKFILREAFRDIIPESIYKRPKFAYRSPDAASFFPLDKKIDYVEHYMSRETSQKVGLFDPEKVESLYNKLGEGDAQNASNRDNMAVTTILSTHILAEEFKVGL